MKTLHCSEQRTRRCASCASPRLRQRRPEICGNRREKFHRCRRTRLIRLARGTSRRTFWRVERDFAHSRSVLASRLHTLPGLRAGGPVRVSFFGLCQPDDPRNGASPVQLVWVHADDSGGTLLELIVPLACGAYFFAKREVAGVAFCLFWFFENFLYIGVYMADARAQALPLVGSGDHDWAILFGQWGMLAHDRGIGQMTRIIGWAGMIAVVVWLGLRMRSRATS